MTIEEFIKLISNWMKEIKKSNDEFEHQDCFMGFEIKNDFDPLKYDNIKVTKSYQELRKIYDIFNLTKRMIEENLFNMFFFKYLDYTLSLLKISKEDCLAITLDRINWAINLCTKEELKKWLHEENQVVLQYPDAVKKLKYKHHSEEEIENQVKLQLQDLKKIRKYIDEDGNILPVPKNESSINDISHILSIPTNLTQIILDECNKKFAQINKSTKKEFIILSVNDKSKVSDATLSLTKPNKEAHYMFNKYINRVGANYIVVFEEEIDENKKIEIIRLAKIIGISEDNQRNILLLIEKHNNMILKQKEEARLKAEREKLMLAIEQIKTTYFTEDMHFAYNKVRCIVNDICLIKDQSLNYIIAKLKVAKEIIDATILGLIKEELTLEDFNELLYLSFEDLNNVLIEAKHYKIINQSLERIKKES